VAQGQLEACRTLPFRHAVKSLCLLAALWLAIGVAAAQKPQRPFGTIVEDWNHSLDLIAREMAQPDLSRERAATLIQRLAAIRSPKASRPTMRGSSRRP
jgi:hypothetical protein